MKPLIIISCLLITFLFCSKKDNVTEEISQIQPKYYLHLAHTRTNDNITINKAVSEIDYTTFDMLWLGGDLANLTSIDDQTMTRVDSLFNLKNPNTLWSLGNHDYSDLNKIQEYTGRTPYYSTYKNGITFIVLDTQDSLSNIVGAQKDLLMNSLDTLQTSTHLILIHHKLIWMYDNIDLESQISSISNADTGNCFYCINPNNFNTEIYPKLIEIKERGVNVICIGGDIGFRAKEFEYTTPEGIHFLASGINGNKENNKALLFQHNLESDDITWQFKSLSELKTR